LVAAAVLKLISPRIPSWILNIIFFSFASLIISRGTLKDPKSVMIYFPPLFFSSSKSKSKSKLK